MQKTNTRRLALAGMIGAAYAALTMLGSVFGLSYGPVQFRVAEALTLLPFLCPEAVGGLFVGCLVANMLSPYGLLDIVIGSLATLLAAWLTSRCRSRYLASLPPVLCNGLMVGALLAYEEVGMTDAFWGVFWFNGCSVAVGEAAVCFGLGLLLLWRLEKTDFIRKFLKKD